MRLARKMGVNKITSLTDSRLVGKQISGEFKTKNKRIEKYVITVKRLVKLFKSFTNKKISRSEADTVNKLTSTWFGHLSKNFMGEVLK